MKHFFTVFSLIMLTFSARSATTERIAHFNWDNEGNIPLRVTFTDASSDPSFITSWRWNFGDGSAESTEKNPVHDYQSPGSYTIKLVVRWGTEEHTTQRTIAISYTADFDWSRPIYINRQVDFYDRTRYAGWCSNNSTYEWDFGDGSITRPTVPNPSHTFDRVGSYTVKLCIRDGCGQLFCKSKSVEVTMPINDLKPSFISTGWVTRKGIPVTFWDKTEPRSDIKWWTWWFEQPRDLSGNYPVQNDANEFYYNYKETVTHTFNRAGIFTVRLYTGTTVYTIDGGYPVPGDIGTYFDKTIKVTETPELTPGAVKNEGPPTIIRDFALNENLAVTLRASGTAFGTNQYFTIYKKNGGDDSETWDFREDFLQVNGNLDAKITHMKISGTSLLLQLQPAVFSRRCYFHVIPEIGKYATDPNDNYSPSLDADWTGGFGRLIAAPNNDNPHSDMHGDEVVVVQKEYNGELCLYLVKKGTTWVNSTVTRYVIANNYTAAMSEKVIINDDAIVTKVGSQIFIFEKQAGNWNFTAKKIINIPVGDDPAKDDFDYAANTLVVTNGSVSGLGFSDPVVRVYERPTTGWPAVSTGQTGELRLSTDDDLKTSSKIFLDPKNISLGGDYIVLKARVVNGSSQITRKYAYRKKFGYWGSPQYPAYKFLQADKDLGVQTTNLDMMNCFPNGKAEFYNYKSYCWRDPYIKTDYTVSGPNFDIITPVITLGGNGKMFFVDPNASILYKGINVTLQPGFHAKPGSRVQIQAADSCDNLYYTE